MELSTLFAELLVGLVTIISPPTLVIEIDKVVEEQIIYLEKGRKPYSYFVFHTWDEDRCRFRPIFGRPFDVGNWTYYEDKIELSWFGTDPRYAQQGYFLIKVRTKFFVRQVEYSEAPGSDGEA